MAKKTWVLTDVDADIYQEQISIGPDQVGGAARNYSMTKRTLRGGLRDGVDVIEVDNGRLRFVVIPTRGMGIWRGRCDDVSLGWLSPVRGPVHPSMVSILEPSGIGWIRGFDELLVRCGLESNGAPEFLSNGRLVYPLHGTIQNRPAHKVEVTIDGDSGAIEIVGVVDETRMFGPKLRLTATVRTKVGACEFSIEDTVQNISAEPGEMELLYHINFGMPLVTGGASLKMPIRRIAPRNAFAAAGIDRWDVYGPETPGLEEACYFFQLAADTNGQTRVLLRSASGQQGISIRPNIKQLPYFTLWKNCQSVQDGYVTGLEPCANFPNPRSFEKQKGRVIALAPGEKRQFSFAVEAHPDAAAVSAAEEAVARLQNGTVPEIVRQPDPNWSAP